MVSETRGVDFTEGQNEAQRMQAARDLLQQVDELAGEGKGDVPEVVFQDISPRRRKLPIYSLRDGERLMIPRSLLQQTLNKRDNKTGKWLFTAHKEEAPEYKLGEIKCFLHPEAAERPLLDEIGLAGKECEAAHLGSRYSRRMHGMHRHKQEWAMYQEYLEDEKDRVAEERQQKQLEATQELARAATQANKAASKVSS